MEANLPTWLFLVIDNGERIPMVRQRESQPPNQLMQEMGFHRMQHVFGENQRNRLYYTVPKNDHFPNLIGNTVQNMRVVPPV